jgi:putative transposase
LPEIPQHVVQRGNNRQAVFFERSDYRRYLDCLEEAGERYGCRVHAYVLMTNHVHLLLTPQEQDSIPKVLQSIGRKYVQYVNQGYGELKSNLVYAPQAA